tara:strand:- start:36 stop:323 length:288 start_codon:yes stop_codon:yes gene_type:complete
VLFLELLVYRVVVFIIFLGALVVEDMVVDPHLQKQEELVEKVVVELVEKPILVIVHLKELQEAQGQQIQVVVEVAKVILQVEHQMLLTQQQEDLV